MPATTADESYVPSRCNLICVCIVAADGSFPLGPDDWTLEKIDTGKYRIVHDLGHTRYVVLPIITGGTHAAAITLLDVDETSVTLYTTEDSAAADVAFTATILAVQ